MSEQAEMHRRISATFYATMPGVEREAFAALDSLAAELVSLKDALERVGTASMLAEFHGAVSHPETDACWLRTTLHDEEHAELRKALESGDRLAIARELADVVYVAYGTAHAYGIDLDAALAEVHRANMQKATAGIRREDGKVIKPPGFVAPDMTAAAAAREALGRHLK